MVHTNYGLDISAKVIQGSIFLDGNVYGELNFEIVVKSFQSYMAKADG